MFKDLFTSASLLDLPVVSMVGFILLFVGTIAWVFARRRRSHYERMSHLPLDDN